MLYANRAARKFCSEGADIKLHAPDCARLKARCRETSSPSIPYRDEVNLHCDDGSDRRFRIEGDPSLLDATCWIFVATDTVASESDGTETDGTHSVSGVGDMITAT